MENLLVILALLIAAVFLLGYLSVLRTVVAKLRVKCREEYNKNVETSRFLKVFSESLAHSGAIEEGMDMTARYAAETVKAEAVCIYIRNDDWLQPVGIYGNYPAISSGNRRREYTIAKVRYLKTDKSQEKIRFGEGLIGEAASHREEVFIPNAAADPRIAELGDCIVPIRALAALPLVNEGHVIGIVCAVNSTEPKGFTQEMFQQFKEVARHIQLAQAILNGFSTLSMQERIAQELEFARNLQMSLIPQEFPVWGNFTIHGFTRPSKEVSGDFYDFMQIDEDRLLVVIGDACGKGIPACMIMAMTRAFIRSAIGTFTTLKDLLNILNDNLYRDTSDGRYITLGCCILDKRASTIEYARAGHTPLLICLRHHIRQINPQGTGLGLLPSELSDFDTICTEVSPGTSMLMFTDGINETTNAKDEFYGIDRVSENYFQSCETGKSPEKVIEELLKDADRFASDKETQELDDDQTVVLIRYT